MIFQLKCLKARVISLIGLKIKRVFFDKIFFKRKKGKKESPKFNGVIQKETEFKKNTTRMGGDFF